MISSTNSLPIQVLFFHRMESGQQGIKSRFISSHFISYIPSLQPWWFLSLVFWRAIFALISFQPHVLVASSWGGFIAMFLQQIGIWKRPTILLAPAMSCLFQKRLYLPEECQKNTIIVLGKHDKIVLASDYFNKIKNPLSSIVHLVNDNHSLNQSMIRDQGLLFMIQKLVNLQKENINTQINLKPFHSCLLYQCSWLWCSCLFHLLLALLREPLTWFYSLKRILNNRKI